MIDIEVPNPLNSQNKDTEQDFDNHVDDNLAMISSTGLEVKAVDAARRLSESEAPTILPKKKMSRGEKIGVGAAVVGTVGAIAGGAAGYAYESTPKPAEQTMTITVEDGQGMLDIVDQIPGSGKYNRQDIANSIAGDPANIDVLKDGLQAGDSITVPVRFD